MDYFFARFFFGSFPGTVQKNLPPQCCLRHSFGFNDRPFFLSWELTGKKIAATVNYLIEMMRFIYLVTISDVNQCFVNTSGKLK